MTYTEDDVRDALSVLAQQGEAEFHAQFSALSEAVLADAGAPRRRRSTLIALSAAASVVAVSGGLVFANNQLGNAGARNDDADGRASSATSSPVPTSTKDERAVTLAEVFAALGDPYRGPGEQIGRVSSDEARRTTGAAYSLGLVDVGQQKFAGDNEATGDVSVTWRLTWVVAWNRQRVWQGTSKAGVEGKSEYVTVTKVAFVDANTGEVYSLAQL